MKLENCLEAEVTLPVDLIIEGKPYRKVILREVIGLDEEAISQPAYKDNAPAMVQELVSRCIAEVPGAPKLPSKKELKDLPVGVIDILVLEIRKLTAGDELQFSIPCENESCKKLIEGTVSISSIPMKEGSFAPVEVTLKRGFTLNGKKIKKVLMKFPDGNMQEQFARLKDLSKFGEVKTDILTACIVSAEGEAVDRSTVSTMGSADRKILSEVLKKSPGPDTAVALACPKCGTEFEAPLNVFDFLA